jgi:delta 1-pyrroline-5-carboxylate dehydrogenase
VLQIQSEGGWTSRQVALGVIAVAGPIDGLGPLLGLLAPALAAGNCVVLSASPREPLAALHLAQVASAGLPPGVLNIVGPDAQMHLAAHPEVAAVWIGLRDSNQLTTETSKRLWRVDYACLDSCPDEFLLHQATNRKTVCSA